MNKNNYVNLYLKNKDLFIISPLNNNSGAPRAPKARARGAPLIRDFGKPISARKFGLVMTSLRPTDRPPVRTYAPPCKPM